MFSVASGISSSGVLFRAGCRGVCSLIVDSVMSVKGVPCRSAGSGEAVACGVGRGGCSSSCVSDKIDDRETPRLCRAARASLTLLRFGAAFFEGDIGSSTTLSGGEKTCDGSMDLSLASTFLVCRREATVLLFGAISPASTVFLRGDPLVLFVAGVNSSSSSLFRVRLTTEFSISEPESSSITVFRRAAARLDGRAGDVSAMARSQKCCRGLVSLS